MPAAVVWVSAHGSSCYEDECARLLLLCGQVGMPTAVPRMSVPACS